MVREAAKPGDVLAHDPLWIYGVPGSVGLFKVAHFTEPPAGGINEAWIDQVRSAMKAQVEPATIAEDRFRVGGKIAAVRFIVSNESMILVRVICQAPRHPPGMIDCLLPRSDHERLGPARRIRYRLAHGAVSERGRSRPSPRERILRVDPAQ